MPADGSWCPEKQKLFMLAQMPCATQRILNIAAYKFVGLDNLVDRRRDLLDKCRSLGLRGTILLSSEGINLFLAGLIDQVREFVEFLRADPAFSDLDPKESYSKEIPFRRMLVRLKKEIISMGVPSVRPAVQTSPKLPAKELKRWLDEGRPVRLLDTRNDYEVDLGTFEGAEHLSIGHFRQFPEAIAQLPEEAKRQPLVMFCTGGIRCEKAGPLMEQAGFENVFQLEGGILKYFEECGGDHYSGACFVFDNRVAVDPQLQPTGNLLCYACQAVLTADDVTSDKYRFGAHCPNCYRPPAEQAAMQLELRQRRIQAAAAAQPGCTPYTNERKIHVAGRFAGWQMIDFLDAYQPAVGREQWQSWLAAGQIMHFIPRTSSTSDDAGAADSHSSFTANDGSCRGELRELAAEQHVVREGECFVQFMPNTVEPAINPHIRLLHEDEWLVVVDKPAPLPTHPSGRYNLNTLLHLMSGAYPNEKLRVAHRLDSNTSGVVVLCRKHQSARFVQPQFAEDRVRKVYLARVHGSPGWDAIVHDAAISDEPGVAGSRQIDAAGSPAVTEFRVLERFADNTTLIEAVPRTGRTHQIRLHLHSLGHPIVGDNLYQSSGLRSCGSVTMEQPPMCLHAMELTLTHPGSRNPVTYRAPRPAWADQLKSAEEPARTAE